MESAQVSKSAPIVMIDSEIAKKVSEMFSEDPRMVNIAWCESNHRQFEADGTPLLSTTSDVGVMQINQVHWDEARNRGLDIFNSVDDNIKMGRIVYDRQGIRAWMALDSKCYRDISSRDT